MLQQYWLGLPEEFRRQLLPGTTGSFRCLWLATQALTGLAPDAALSERQRSMLLHAGRDLLLAAWECDPLNGDLARQVLDVERQAPWLQPETRRMLEAVAERFVRPENLRYYQRLADQGDGAKLRSYVSGERAKAPDNLYWLQQAVAVAELYGDLDWALEQVRAWSPVRVPGTLYADLMAHLHAARGDHATVLDGTAHGAAVAPGVSLLAAERRAHSLWMLGQREDAVALWRAILQVRPWHVNVLLRAHDATQGRDAPDPAGLPGRVAALLYSWNKADDLHAALESIAPSVPDLHRLVVLDNGSTDGTAAMLRTWQERLGERMHTITLPVNVGAPAARNWLKNLPELAETEFVAYLDDDAMLPADWLHHMARGVAVYPGASVWGGKIIDHQAPHIVQSADLHLTMTGGSDEEVEAAFSPLQAYSTPFNVTDIHAQMADVGGFAYMRPCVSVTGCCHLFRTEQLMETGDFSLALSPSQYDDLEHDLRMALSGHYCAYTGFLAVRHMKRTGKATRMSAAQFGNGAGNKYKLHTMYTRQDIARIMQWEADLLERDLLEKAIRLHHAL